MEDLARFTLIEAGDAHYTHLEWLTWRHWLDEQGQPKLQPKRWLTFNYAYQMVQAALTGQGVVLGRTPLIAEHLSSGELVEPLKNFAEPGDVLVAISGSGNSPNVVNATEWANAAGLTTIGLTGRDGGRVGRAVQLEVNVPNPHMGRIEDAHHAICHMVAYWFMEQAGGTPVCGP